MTNSPDDYVFQRRPWGWMIKLIHTRKLWIKLIRVYTRTSLQSHRYRVEYHISFFRIKKVEIEQVHRMTRGWYIEIATGMPAEEDITRFADDYGRV